MLTDPSAFGLDAMFPAFFAVLLWGEARGRLPMTAALIGAVIALALMPFAPPGVPVLAASAAALLGLRPREDRREHPRRRACAAPGHDTDRSRNGEAS